MIAARCASLAAAALIVSACGSGGADQAEQVQDRAPQAAAGTFDAGTAATGEPAQSAIWGTWVVSEARLTDPEGPVQAYGDEQLAALAGAELTVSREEARWTGAGIDGEDPQFSAFRMVCGDPQVLPGATPDTATITCADGSSFGPPAASADDQPMLTGDDALTLRWYDGVTLVLRRAL